MEAPNTFTFSSVPSILPDVGTRLTPKEQIFAEAYANPVSPTFSNGTHSALVAYDTDDDNTAASIASVTLRKPKVQTYVQAILEAHNLGYGKLLKVTASVRAPITVQSFFAYLL